MLALVTAPDLATARRLAKAALKTRTAACVNLIPEIESHYWWQGKIEVGTELLMLFKTTKSRLAELEGLIMAKHPYDTPEFLVIRVERGAERYLAWLEGSLR